MSLDDDTAARPRAGCAARGIGNQGNRDGSEPLQQKRARGRSADEGVGNPHRLAILCLLLEGEKSVGQLVQLIGLSQSALSQHLAGCGTTAWCAPAASAQVIYYALDGAQARAVLETLHRLYCRDGEPADRKRERARRRARRLAPRLDA